MKQIPTKRNRSEPAVLSLVTIIRTLARAHFLALWGAIKEKNYHKAFTKQAGFRLI